MTRTALFQGISELGRVRLTVLVICFVSVIAAAVATLLTSGVASAHDGATALRLGGSVVKHAFFCTNGQQTTNPTP